MPVWIQILLYAITNWKSIANMVKEIINRIRGLDDDDEKDVFEKELKVALKELRKHRDHAGLKELLAKIKARHS